MMEIERPKIETASLSPDGRYGKFVAEPLERGFGITLGNSLRRVLLSSLPGVAVTSVKIDGVVHEFSTIEGVKEDVTEIVLNLKGIAAKLYTDGPKTVRVEAVGPCEVTADNIKQGDDIEILNPEWHIATLGEGGKLVMELTFDKGRGYVPAERNKQAIIEKNDINIHVPEGAIPKDGPSAGITICIAVISALTNTPVRRDLAMTGEITLRGRVLAIGGLREKTMGALRAGVHTVILPKENEKDLDEIDPLVREKLRFVPVETVDAVFAEALVLPEKCTAAAHESYLPPVQESAHGALRAGEMS